MASSSSKLTKYQSAVTIVTANVANSWFGGLYGSPEASGLDADDPRVIGHIHDGQHLDGHSGKIDLADHVTSQLKNINLADDAVTPRNVQSFTTQGDAIPEFEVIDSVTYYYLDLSDIRSSISGTGLPSVLSADNETTGNNIVVNDTDIIYFGDNEEVNMHYDASDLSGVGQLSIRLQEKVGTTHVVPGISIGGVGVVATGITGESGQAVFGSAAMFASASGSSVTTGGVLVTSGPTLAVSGTAGDTGVAFLTSGDSGSAASGNVKVESGEGATTSGDADILTGDADLASGAITLLSGESASASSGAVSMKSGPGSTGTGVAELGSGDASSGSSGAASLTTGTGTTNSGSISVTTGNASSDSGDINLTIGTAGGTRGSLVVSAPIMDISAESDFQIEVSDNSSDAFRIRNTLKGPSAMYLETGTVSTNDVLRFGPKTADVSTSSGDEFPAILSISPHSPFRYEHSNLGQRAVYEENFYLLPSTSGVPSVNQNYNFYVTGTGTPTTNFSSLGYWIAGTSGSINDSVFLRPTALSGSNRWAQTQWTTGKKCSFGIHFALGITSNVRAEFGIRATENAFDDTTDADKFMLRYDSSVSSNWFLVTTNASSTSTTDTGVAASSFPSEFQILHIGDDIYVYIDNELVIYEANAMNSTSSTVIGDPFFAVKTLSNAVRTAQISKLSVGFNLYT